MNVDRNIKTGKERAEHSMQKYKYNTKIKTFQ